MTAPLSDRSELGLSSMTAPLRRRAVMRIGIDPRIRQLAAAILAVDQFHRQHLRRAARPDCNVALNRSGGVRGHLGDRLSPDRGRSSPPMTPVGQPART